MAANKELMALLHQLLAENMLERLKKDKAEEMLTDAATLGAIRAFLKDNEITSDPADSSDLDKLRENLKQQSAARRKIGNVISLATDDAKEA